MRRRTVVLLACAVLVAAMVASIAWPRRTTEPPTTPTVATPPVAAGAHLVGSTRCRDCHAAEHAAWQGSHHQRAMEKPSAASVLAAFAGSVDHHGLPTRFTADTAGWRVDTDGPDGRTATYPVAYTFGHTPLQQYLLRLPSGALQSFPWAWDTRGKDVGGARWFHLYAHEKLAAGDPLHWTSPVQNADATCVACHTTGFRLGFDQASGRHDSTWHELGVSCESCHGPGSRHVAWGERRRAGAIADSTDDGLVSHLKRPAGAWTIDPASGNARWSGAARHGRELDACADCHSRRRDLAPAGNDGRPFLDRHVPALLENGLYHADGHFLDEVFEYGSFVQSRMHHAGVTCADCHEPHGLALRAPGDALCARCHDAGRYEAPSHHRHQPGSAGASCRACHMPGRHYMTVDWRRDHAFRVPRPDLTPTLGTPNACQQCHRSDQPPAARPPGLTAATPVLSDAALAERAAQWWPGLGRRSEFASALAAGRRGAADAGPRLLALAGDAAQPGIARATALTLLPPGRASVAAASAASRDADPLLRLAAARALTGLLPAEQRAGVLAPLLDDARIAVRHEAVRALAEAPAAALGDGGRAARARELDRLHRDLTAVAGNRVDTWLTFAELALAAGRPDQADGHYATALRLDPRSLPALLNAADLRRAQGMDEAGERLLKRALAVDPACAEAEHALGLLAVRARRLGEALSRLRRASELRPESSRFAYVLAVALADGGDLPGARSVLEAAHRRRPGDLEPLQALVAYCAQAGDAAAARRYADALLKLDPEDATAREMLQRLSP